MSDKLSILVRNVLGEVAELLAASERGASAGSFFESPCIQLPVYWQRWGTCCSRRPAPHWRCLLSHATMALGVPIRPGSTLDPSGRLGPDHTLDAGEIGLLLVDGPDPPRGHGGDEQDQDRCGRLVHACTSLCRAYRSCGEGSPCPSPGDGTGTGRAWKRCIGTSSGCHAYLDHCASRSSRHRASSGLACWRSKVFSARSSSM